MYIRKLALTIIFTLVLASLGMAAENALKNPSFETKDDWTTIKGHISFKPDGETQPRTGNMVAFVGGWSGANGEYINQTTTLQIQPGKKYTLSAWFAPRKYTDTTFGGYMLRIIAANDKGRFPVALLRSNEILSDWTEKKLVWTAPQDLTQTPEVHGLTGAPTGKTVDISNATIEVLIGKSIGNGDAYYQTMIDDAKLWEGDDEPEDYDPATDPALQPRDMSILWPSEPETRASRLSLKTLNVRFPTPGVNAYDSMPLGNGETAANVWTTGDGQICFYLSRTDAWSGIGRILKVGRVRMEVTPNPFADAGAFEQELDLESASVIIKGSDNFRARLFVDANAQAMRVQVTGDEPFVLKVRNDPWRTTRRTLTSSEQHSAYPMIGGPAQYMTVEPDTIVPAKANQLVWYHRNGMSPFPVTLQQQKLGHLLETFKDPYLGRTFGGLIQGPGLFTENNLTLGSSPTKKVEFVVLTHTSQPDSAEAWLVEIASQAAALKSNTEAAFAAHKKWWSDFWARSHIHASGPRPETFQSSAILRDAQASLVIGADPRGMLGFQGRIARASVFSKTCTPEEVAFLAATKHVRDLKQVEPEHFYESWDFSAMGGGKVPNAGSHPGRRPELVASGTVSRAVDDGFGAVAQLDGSSHFKSARGVLDIFTGGTLEAWIRPEASEKGGRIFDKSQPGLELGFWMDTGTDGRSLRSNRYDCTDENPGVLTPGQWQHVAMVFDQEHGQVISYVDGREVGRSTFKQIHEADPRSAPGIFHLTQGYALQRFVNACAGRGNYPIKFNGSILTMEGSPVRWLTTPFDEDADFRMWGPDYWFQNTRLPYWPMLHAGDYDLMESFWQLYLDTLPMAQARTRTYFGHEGAYWPETITLFGTFNNQNYGWQRPADLHDAASVNRHIRYYYSGALELLMMMFDRYAHTEDDAFAREKILPIAGAVIAFYDEHYERDANGVLQITPAQALETYNVDHHFVNPAPPVAGLHAITDRLLNELPSGMADSAERERWKRFKKELPPVPYDPELDVLLVAEKKENGARADRYLNGRGNGECPELYPVFPYRLYALGTEGVQTGRNRMERLPGYYTGGWNQDAVNAAMLGDTERAAAFTYWNFATWNPESRFPGFYGPNYDWVPDQDHGGTAMNAAQRMLIQPVGDKIHLLPAWPKEWDVDFKLHAPDNTVVEMTVFGGRLVKLETRPASRKADCVLPDWLGGPRETYVPPGKKSSRELKPSTATPESAALPEPGAAMFFDRDDLDAIRSKVRTGRGKEMMDMVRVVARDFMGVQTRPYDSDGPYIGRNIQAQVGVLAFVGMVDNDAAMTAKAKEILMAAVDQHDIHVYIKANDHLSVGDGASGVAIAYDWLRDELSPVEQRKVRFLLQDMVDFLHDSSVNPGPHPYQRAHNHSVVAHNGMLMAAHMLGRKDVAEYCVPWIRDFLKLIQDGSGAPYEGAGYAEYGMIHGFMASELLQRNYGIDLFEETEGLSLLPHYMLHLMQPWNEGLIPLGQTGKSLAAASGQYYVINRLKDEAGMFTWNAQLIEKGIPGLAEVGHPSHKSMYPFLVLWTDNSIGAKGPRETGEPVFAQFNRGIVTARSAWGDPDAGLVTFVSQRLPHLGIWDHPDENSYTFTAFGDNLVIDPGPHIYNQQGSHNQVLLDGTGPNFGGPGHRTQGRLLKAEDRGQSVYMVADAADAYRNDSWDKPNGLKVEKVLRRILFVRASRPFVVVVDDFVMGDGRPHDFTLRHIFASNASHDYNKLEMDGSKARIIGGRNGSIATLHYLQPEELTLSQSTVEGTYGKSCTALDASGARGKSAQFRTVVTSAPGNEAPATVQADSDGITIRFANGAAWRVVVSDEDIVAARTASGS